MKNSSYYIQDSQNIMSDLLVRTFEKMPMVRIFDKGRSIYRQGDNAECFYYLKKGRVRIFLASENGTEKTLSVIGKGSILGEAAFFDGQNRMSSASAVVKSELVSVNKSILTDIIRREPRTAFEIFRLQAQTIRMLSSQIDGMTFQTAKSRIAQFLLRSAEDNVDELAGCYNIRCSSNRRIANDAKAVPSESLYWGKYPKTLSASSKTQYGNSCSLFLHSQTTSTNPLYTDIVTCSRLLHAKDYSNILQQTIR